MTSLVPSLMDLKPAYTVANPVVTPDPAPPTE